jgi:hypothetical protein
VSVGLGASGKGRFFVPYCAKMCQIAGHEVLRGANSASRRGDLATESLGSKEAGLSGQGTLAGRLLVALVGDGKRC